MKQARSILSELLERTPVCVTGVGAMTAAGSNVAALWESALNGVLPRQEMELGFPTKSGQQSAWVAGIDDEMVMGGLPRSVRKLDRAIQLAWHAVEEAVDSARLEISPRVQLIAGTSRGLFAKSKDALDFNDSQRARPGLATDCTIASLSGALAQELGMTGAAHVVSAACASGAYGLIVAAEALLLGKADVVIVVASDAALHPAVLHPLAAAGVLGSAEEGHLASRPFDSRRNGFVLGEGAGCVVLERLSDARARGANVRAQLTGWAAEMDQHGRAGIDTTGTALHEVMAAALAMSKTSSPALINAHGTGTLVNDAAEAAAIAKLGTKAVVQSTKALTGHCLGATPLLELILAIRQMEEDTILPTYGCDESELGLNLAMNAPTTKEVSSVLSTSLAFWGYQAALVVEKASGFDE